MKRATALRAAAVLAMLVCAAAGVAHAQTSGVLSGQVFDQTGVPLAGVQVSITSPTQIGGAKSMTTDAQGRFRFVGLTPGTFALTARAKGLRKYVQDDIPVLLNRRAELDIIMEVETSRNDEVTVVTRAPTVNTTTARVGETYDKEFLDSLPLSTRDYQGVQALTPGVRDDGTGNPSVRGGSYFNNNYTIDGFETTDPVTHTFGTNFSFDAMNQVDVQTAGFGAQNAGTTGGLTEIVTKSGSNRFEVETTGNYSDQNLQFFKDAADRGRDFRSAELSLNLGGPIIKDRLWFYVSTQFLNSILSVPRDLTGQFPDHPPASILALNAFAKLTWQMTPRHKLELKLIESPGVFNNVLNNVFVEPEAEARSFQETRFAGLTLNSVLVDDLIFVARVGVTHQKLRTDPQSCDWDPNCGSVPGSVDILSGVSRGNFSSRLLDVRWTYQASGNLEYFKSVKGLGSHDVKLGWSYYHARSPVAVSVPGDAVFFTAGEAPFARTTFCSNDPSLSPTGECRGGWLRSVTESDSLKLFLQDAWKPTRYVTITPGVAFHRGSSANDRNLEITDLNVVTPHLAVSWDATHDGKTALRASYNENVDTGFLSLARYTGRTLASEQCRWDESAQAYIGNCIRGGGESGITVGLPCSPDGVNPDGTSCKTKLRAPRVHELTLGGEREILTGVVLGADYIYRKYVHQWEDRETNLLWNEGGTALRADGSFRNGRNRTVFDLETPDEAQRRYHAVTVFLRKRQGLLKVNLSYTWSRLWGPVDDDFVTLFLDNPRQTPLFYGPLDGDVRHDVRLQASYQIRPWVAAGVIYNFETGAPYNRYGFDSVFNSYSRFETRRGYDWRRTPNPDDDLALRLPDVSSLNLQARFNLRSLTGQNLEIFADIFNILSLRTTLAVAQSDNQNFGFLLARQAPTRARIGVRYRY